jgi:hypothetical protein
MNESLPSDWQVDIVTKGRDGNVIYHEGSDSASFYWEFGGGDVVAIIHLGPASDWSKRFPWAAERRADVLNRMVNDVIRQKAHDCTAEMEYDGRSFVHLCKR